MHEKRELPLRRGQQCSQRGSIEEHAIPRQLPAPPLPHTVMAAPSTLSRPREFRAYSVSGDKMRAFCWGPSLSTKSRGGLLARAQQTPTRAVPTGRSAQRCESTIRFSGRSVQRCESTMRFTSQNVRSLTDHTTDGSNAKQDELFAHMHTHKINIALLAETWRLGSEDLQAGLQGKFLMLHHGLAAKTCNR